MKLIKVIYSIKNVYNYKGNLITNESSNNMDYEGDWANGKKNGYGKNVLIDGTVEEGKFVDGNLVPEEIH